MRSLFGQYMEPGVFEEQIVPLLPNSELESLRELVASYIPGWAFSKATRNDVVALQNEIRRVLSEKQGSASR